MIIKLTLFSENVACYKIAVTFLGFMFLVFRVFRILVNKMFHFTEGELRLVT